ncbi:hypothetical protein DIPPA_09001 [Diplonema papillatum]|nr:hypothetical protein DIPPA_09001 [Diplonema papillatum]
MVSYGDTSKMRLDVNALEQRAVYSTVSSDGTGGKEGTIDSPARLQLLKDAVRSGNVKHFLACLNRYKGMVLKASEKDGSTVLHTAVEEENEEMCLLILRKRAFPSTQKDNGDTPLHLACERGNFNVAMLLIRYGASLVVPNNDGKTPADVARCNRHTALCTEIEMLIMNRKCGSGVRLDQTSEGVHSIFEPSSPVPSPFHPGKPDRSSPTSATANPTEGPIPTYPMTSTPLKPGVQLPTSADITSGVSDPSESPSQIINQALGLDGLPAQLTPESAPRPAVQAHGPSRVNDEYLRLADAMNKAEIDAIRSAKEQARLEREATDAKREVEELKDTITRLDEALQHSESEKNGLREAETRLFADIQKLTDASSEAEQRVRDQTAKYDNLVAKHEALHARLRAEAKSHTTALQDTVNKSSASLSDLHEKLTRTSRELAEARDALLKAEARLDTDERIVRDKDATIASLQRTLAEHATDEALREELAAAEAALQEARSALTEREAAFVRLERKLADAKEGQGNPPASAGSGGDDKLVALISDLQSRYTTASSELSAVESQKDVLAGQLQELEHRFDATSAKLRETEAQHAALLSSLAEPASGDLRHRVRELEGKNASLEGEVADAKKQQSSALGRLESTEHARSALRRELSGLMASPGFDSPGSFPTNGTQHEDLEAKLLEEAQRSADLASRLAKAERDITELEAMRSTQEQRSETRTGVEAKLLEEAQRSADLASRLAKAERDIAELEAVRSTQEQHSETRLRDVDTGVERMTARLVEVEDSLRAATRQKSELEARLGRAAAELSAARAAADKNAAASATLLAAAEQRGSAAEADLSFARDALRAADARLADALAGAASAPKPPGADPWQAEASLHAALAKLADSLREADALRGSVADERRRGDLAVAARDASELRCAALEKSLEALGVKLARLEVHEAAVAEATGAMSETEAALLAAEKKAHALADERASLKAGAAEGARREIQLREKLAEAAEAGRRAAGETDALRAVIERQEQARAELLRARAADRESRAAASAAAGSAARAALLDAELSERRAIDSLVDHSVQLLAALSASEAIAATKIEATRLADEKRTLQKNVAALGAQLDASGNREAALRLQLDAADVESAKRLEGQLADAHSLIEELKAQMMATESAAAGSDSEKRTPPGGSFKGSSASTVGHEATPGSGPRGSPLGLSGHGQLQQDERSGEETEVFLSGIGGCTRIATPDYPLMGGRKIPTIFVPDIDDSTGKVLGKRPLSTQTNPRLFYQEQCVITGTKINQAFLDSLPSDPAALRHVDIAHNYIGKKGTRAVLDVVRLCERVSSLDFSDNKIENGVITWLVDVARDHPALVSINLDSNLIAKSGGAALLQLLHDKPAITHLSIDKNPLLMNPMIRRIEQKVEVNRLRVAVPQ